MWNIKTNDNNCPTTLRRMITSEREVRLKIDEYLGYDAFSTFLTRVMPLLYFKLAKCLCFGQLFYTPIKLVTDCIHFLSKINSVTLESTEPNVN